jgi:hypothetical protein
MTETSLLPMAARYAGIDFDDLVEKIMLTARLKEIKPGSGLNTVHSSHPS